MKLQRFSGCGISFSSLGSDAGLDRKSRARSEPSFQSKFHSSPDSPGDRDSLEALVFVYPYVHGRAGAALLQAMGGREDDRGANKSSAAHVGIPVVWVPERHHVGVSVHRDRITTIVLGCIYIIEGSNVDDDRRRVDGDRR